MTFKSELSEKKEKASLMVGYEIRKEWYAEEECDRPQGDQSVPSAAVSTSMTH